MTRAFWIQPRNAWWWFAAIVTAVSMVIAAVLSGLPFIAIDASAGALSFGLYLVFMFIGWQVLARTPIAPDHPFQTIAAAMAWGSLGSLGTVLVFGTGITNLANVVNNASLVASFGGAIPEEPVKLLGVLIVYQLARKWVWHPAHFVVLGMAAGLGFDIVENMVYGSGGALLDPNSDIRTILTVWGLRLMVGTLAHMVWTGIAGYGLGQMVIEGRKSGVSWLFVAIALHFLFNVAWDFEHLIGAAYAETATISVLVALWLVSVSILIWIWTKVLAPYRTARDHRAALANTAAQPAISADHHVPGPQAGYTPNMPVYSDPS